MSSKNDLNWESIPLRIINPVGIHYHHNEMDRLLIRTIAFTRDYTINFPLR